MAKHTDVSDERIIVYIRRLAWINIALMLAFIASIISLGPRPKDPFVPFLARFATLCAGFWYFNRCPRCRRFMPEKYVPSCPRCRAKYYDRSKSGD